LFLVRRTVNQTELLTRSEARNPASGGYSRESLASPFEDMRPDFILGSLNQMSDIMSGEESSLSLPSIFFVVARR
jgi:hypothetical protein